MSSSDELLGGMTQEVWFTIPGKATGVFLGVHKTTLGYIQQRTGCTALEMLGEWNNKTQVIMEGGLNMDIGHKIKKDVSKLMKTHKGGDWCVKDATLLLKNGNDLGATTTTPSHLQGGDPNAGSLAEQEVAVATVLSFWVFDIRGPDRQGRGPDKQLTSMQAGDGGTEAR